MQAKIKKIKKRDYEEVDMLLKVAFEDESVAQLFKELVETDEFVHDLTFVARINNSIIGIIVYSQAEIVKGKKSHNILSIAPIAVLPNYQHLGIGSELMQESFDRARELEYSNIVVMGHEGYYPRFGFKPASEYNVTCPFDIDNENFMVKELFPDTLKGVSGKVKYHPLFNQMPSFTI